MKKLACYFGEWVLFANAVLMNNEFSVWQSVSQLTPVRASGVSFVERLVRAEPWLFIHNEITGQHARVSELARQVVQRMDGRQTIESLVAELANSTDTVEKEALAASLLTLSQLGMVNLGAVFSDRVIQERAAQLLSKSTRLWHNPLAIKIPLFDPDRWLARVNKRFGSILNLSTLWVFVAVISIGFVLGLLNVGELSSQLGVLAKTPQQWWQIIVIYPLLKCVHEFAHGIVIKRLSGSCHEAGLTILILMPVPYVDATDIWRFESRRQRMLVSAAGMLAEGVIASTALMIWLVVEPGFIADLVFAVALTGSVTTLFFNANPLLKFDGYQILQGALDIPNLASRSSRYVSFLFKYYLLGVTTIRSPVTGAGERAWLFSYAVAAATYRWAITVGIAIYLAANFAVVGGLLAIFLVYKLTISPCVAVFKYLSTAVELNQRRARAVSVSACLVVGCMVMVFLVPLPTHTRAQGVVDVPHQAQLFAPQTGELAELFVKPGDTVEPGQRVLRIAAPDLTTQMEVIESELAVLETQYHAAIMNDPASAASHMQSIADKQYALDQVQSSVHSLVIYSEVAGRVSLAEKFTRLGEFVEEGAVLGHIVNAHDLVIKAIVREGDIARVERGVRSVSIRLAERFWEPFPGRMSYVTPAATRNLPSQALAEHITFGGIAVASSDQFGMKTVEPVFQLEFELPENTRTVGIGGRAYMTLVHSSEPIGTRSWRALRRLVMTELAL